MAKKQEKEKVKDDKARLAFINQLRKTMNLGNDAIRYADEIISITDVISTGHVELDRIMATKHFEKTGKGGVPLGFICEFYGPFAGGKSSLSLMLAASVTKAGGMVLWIDAENSFVDDWARSQGVILENVVHMPSGSPGETYLAAAQQAAVSGHFRLIVIDSVTALVPKDSLERSLEEEERVGVRAKMLTRALPRIVDAAKQGNCAVVFINQIRQRPGVMYGNPETTPGGEALKFYSSLRLRLSKVSSKNQRGIEKDGEEIGIRSNIKVTKSRFGPPDKETLLPIYYSDIKPEPLDMLLDMAMCAKIIKCRTRKTGEEMVQYFTLEGSDRLKGIPGFDEFKGELHKEDKQEIGRRLQEKKALDPEIIAYLGSLEHDDPLEAAPSPVT